MDLLLSERIDYFTLPTRMQGSSELCGRSSIAPVLSGSAVIHAQFGSLIE